MWQRLWGEKSLSYFPKLHDTWQNWSQIQGSAILVWALKHNTILLLRDMSTESTSMKHGHIAEITWIIFYTGLIFFIQLLKIHYSYYSFTVEIFKSICNVIIINIPKLLSSTNVIKCMSNQGCYSVIKILPTALSNPDKCVWELSSDST